MSTTPRTDAAINKCYLHSFGLADFARTLETELAAVMKERDALLARETPTASTPEGLLYRYRNDRAFHELVDQLALTKFLPERDALIEALKDART